MADPVHLDTKEAANSRGQSAATRSEGHQAPDPVGRSLGAPSRDSELSDLHIEDRRIDSLTSRRRNPRTHSAKQIRQIADSIQTFGFTNPLLVDATGIVIAGHGRLRAAELLGMETVPTIHLDHLSEEQARALVIADNKLAELAGWDEDLLALELEELAELDLDFDLEVIGFETAEIDLLIGTATKDVDPDPADELPDLDPDAPAVSRSGDLWVIGPHRLVRSQYSSALILLRFCRRSLSLIRRE